MSSESLAIAWYLHRSVPERLRLSNEWPPGARRAAPPEPSERIPTRELAELLESLVRAADPTVPARAGVEAGERPATALPLALRAAPDVAGQLDLAATFWRTVGSGRLERRTLRDATEVVVVDDPRERRPGHEHLAAFFVGLLVGALRQASVIPIAIELPGRGPGSLNGSSTRVFGVHAQPGADHARVRIASRDLRRAPSGADARIAEYLRRQLAASLEGLRAATTWQVDALLRDHLADGLCMRATARRLGLSERTLRRRLDEEGTSFRERLDHVRRARALELLAHEDVSAVARRLGFVDARSFQRAFRRWMRVTPAAYVRSLRAPAMATAHR